MLHVIQQQEYVWLDVLMAGGVIIVLKVGKMHIQGLWAHVIINIIFNDKRNNIIYLLW